MASTRQAEDDRSRRSETSRPHVVALLVFSRSLLYWVETPWCCTMRKPLRAREAICGHLSMGLHVNDSGSIEQWPRIVILAVSRRFGPYGSPYCDLPARSPTWRWEPPRQSKRLMSEKQAASAQPLMARANAEPYSTCHRRSRPTDLTSDRPSDNCKSARRRFSRRAKFAYRRQ